MTSIIFRFVAEEDGVTAVEYAVMLALIIAACLTAVAAVGESASGSFSNSRDRINDAVNTGN